MTGYASAVEAKFKAVGFAGLDTNQILSAQAAGMLTLARDTESVTTGAEQISKAYGVSLPAALQIAQAAGVSLESNLKTQSGAWTQAGDQVKDYMQGMASMGLSSGQVGHDMLAVAIQTGETATKVSQLNQAWDAFMQGITGGTSAMGELGDELQNIGQITQSAGSKFGEFQGKFSASTSQFATALKSFGGEGSQAWQNFDDIIGSTMPQLVDWFREAGSEGALGSNGIHKISKAVLDMASEMVPFAAKSKTAQAELVAFAQESGLNISTFAQLKQAIKDTGASSDDLKKQVDATTIALGNMSQIAQNLGDVMAGQVTAALSQAALKASGFYTDTTNLSEALEHGAAAGHNATYWADQVAAAYNKSAQQAASSADAIQRRNKALVDTPGYESTTLNIAYTTTGTPGGHRAYAQGGIVNGPSGFDNIPAWLTAGESVLTRQATAALGADTIHALNASPSQAVLSSGGGGGMQTMTLNQHVTVELDGTKIGSQWRTEQLVYSRRNNSPNVQLRVR
jgi:hypothetical protein